MTVKHRKVLIASLAAIGLLLILVLFFSRNKENRQTQQAEIAGNKPATTTAMPPADSSGKEKFFPKKHKSSGRIWHESPDRLSDPADEEEWNVPENLKTKEERLDYMDRRCRAFWSDCGGMLDDIRMLAGCPAFHSKSDMGDDCIYRAYLMFYDCIDENVDCDEFAGQIGEDKPRFANYDSCQIEVLIPLMKGCREAKDAIP